VVAGGADQTALTALVAEAAEGPVDLVVDPVWGVPAAAAAGALGPGGRLVNLGDSAGATSPLVSAVVRSRVLDIRGWTNLALDWAGQRDLLAQVLDHAAAGRVHVRHDVRPLAEVTQAWRDQLERRSRARVVLVP